jgi:hypothetical protein
MNKQKFNHYFAIIVDVVYISGFIALLVFTINTALSSI